MKFCLFDVSNMVHRAKHVVEKPRGVIDLEERETYGDERLGMIFHIVFNSIRSAYQKFGADHAIMCFDRRSWRRDYLTEYKEHRREDQTLVEQREHELTLKSIDMLRDFFRDQTNVTVLEAQGVEADDFIARWTQLHSDEVFNNIIISVDSDFKQLVQGGVELFDPIRGILYSKGNIFVNDGKRFKNTDTVVKLHNEKWKVKLDKNGDPEVFDPKWELFEKCIRGDSSDNIRSAWPRVTTVAMKKAFYGTELDWNNFINSTYGEGDVKTSVRERYEQNRMLIDLTAQPQEIKDKIDEQIEIALNRPARHMVGSHFAKFCSRHGLINTMNQAEPISRILNAKYGD